MRVVKIYYTLSCISTLLYPLLHLIGRIWDTYSTLSTTIANIAIILLLINATVKVCHALGLLLAKPTAQGKVLVAGDIVALLIVGLILYGNFWERHQLRTTELELHYDNLPESADGLRIAQIGDIHIGLGLNRYRMLEKLAEGLDAADADIIIDCGDMTSMRHTELDSQAMEILSRITAPLGVYTVIGNHDNGSYLKDTVAIPRKENVRLLREHQQQMGWHNITDTTALLKVGGDTLYLTALDYPSQIKKGEHGVGVDDDYTPHFNHLPEEAFNIVVAHTPIVWENILAACDAELTLSGHVHAMQLKFPFGKRGWSPAAIVYTHWSGLYRNGDNALHITDGVGSSMPVRIGVKPEIVVLTLRRTKE